MTKAFSVALVLLVPCSMCIYADDDGWIDARRPVRQGDVEVQIQRLGIGKVDLDDLGQSAESKDSFFTVVLKITNLSSTKKIDYQGWASRSWGIPEGRASLRDDTGNSYSRCHFGLSEVVGQVDDAESIYPKKTLSDCLVFELPTDTCQALFLELPGSAFDGRGVLRIKIPRSLWDDKVRKEEEAAQKVEAKRAKEAELQEEMKRKKKAAEQLRWRTWTSNDGKFSAKAKYLKWVGDEVYEKQRKALREKWDAEEQDEKKRLGKPTMEPYRRFKEAMKSVDAHITVRLEKEDGKILNVNKERLSGEDREWVEEFDLFLDDVDRLKHWSLEKIVQRYKHIEYTGEEAGE